MSLEDEYDELIEWLFRNHIEVFNQWAQIIGEEE